MANELKKITALTAGTPLDTDVIPYVDLVTGTTKKALKSELKGDTGETGATGATGATGPAGADGDNAYVYIAYASADDGTGFTMTFDADLDYIAIKNSATEIVSPQASDFTGLWKNYKGATGDTGPTGPAGDGDVNGPATNSADYLPQWDGANSKTLKNGIPTSTFAPALGADDNYVTDAEKVKLSNLSGTNTGDQTLPTRDSLGLDTDDSPQFAGLNIGHATDTTVTRVSAGVIAVEGVNVLTVAGGTLTGNIVYGENTSTQLDPSLSADGKYSGVTIIGTAGATVAFGDLITLDKDDSRWELVDISVAAAATGDARGILGMAVSTGNDGDSITILLQGNIRADANFPTLTIGAPIYASTTGDVVVTQPTTTDYVIRIVGYGLTADSMYFNPGNTWTTHT